MADKRITVDVPEERVPEFYLWFAHFLAQDAAPVGGRRPGRPWGHAHGEPREWTDDDLEAARSIYGRLSPPARTLFDVLIDGGGEPVSGNDLAGRLNLDKGAHGVAGILAWPGRWSRKLGLAFPIVTEARPDGGTDYRMPANRAELFARARG